VVYVHNLECRGVLMRPPTPCPVVQCSVPGEVVKLLTVLFGGRETEAGRVCLIVRMGCKRVRTVLPGIVDAVLQTKLPVVWLCDPMHGNTVKLPSGYKTRDLDHIVGVRVLASVCSPFLHSLSAFHVWF